MESRLSTHADQLPRPRSLSNAEKQMPPSHTINPAI